MIHSEFYLFIYDNSEAQADPAVVSRFIMLIYTPLVDNKMVTRTRFGPQIHFDSCVRLSTDVLKY